MTNHDAKNFPPIAALASGTAPSAIAVIRLSGFDCHNLLKKNLKKNRSSDLSPRKMTLVDFLDQEKNHVIDSLLVTFFPKESSFTGEEYAEIHCHGSPYIITKILTVLYASGFREAAPGEFTKRAFLNHRLDLTSAEGIDELIRAQSHQQWLAARQLVSGELKKRIESLRKTLLEAMAHLDARLDFPDEEDVEEASFLQIIKRVEEARATIFDLVSTYDSGRIASEGFMVGLFGPPNAGKSTLMNKLLCQDRVIVTPLPGTTRDYVEEKCLIDGRFFRLFDMAGIRTPRDEIEKIGIQKAWELAEKMDLLLILIAADTKADEEEEINKLISQVENRAFQLVLTKNDLPLSNFKLPNQKKHGKPLAISCNTGVGLGELKRLLVSKIDTRLHQISERHFITRVRHLHGLEQSLKYLDNFIRAKESGHYEECLAFELREAIKALSSVIGEIFTEDILDEIFSRFCLGK